MSFDGKRMPLSLPQLIAAVTVLWAAGCVSIPGAGKGRRPTRALPAPPPKTVWKATASSCESEQYAARNAIDGDPGTRWSSAWSDPQWLQIDMGSPVNLCGVVIRWETAYALRYRIETSTDGNIWQTARTIPLSDGHTDYIFFRPRAARYVRLLGVERATGWGYSVWEIDLIGAAQSPQIKVSGKKVQAAGAAFDGLATSVWTTPSLPVDFVVDLGQSLPLGGIRFEWGESFPARGAIHTSLDGHQWDEAGGFDGGRGKFDVVMFAARTCRYIRVSLPDPTDTPVQIREIILRGPDEDMSPLALYAVAAEKSPPLYPRYLTRRQTFWTAVGPPQAPRESLLDEFGAVEPQAGSPAVFPYLVQGKRISSLEQLGSLRYTLARGYCPIPCLEAIGSNLSVRVCAVPWTADNRNATAVRYQIVNRSAQLETGRLVLVIRPLQTNPPWQYGGWAPIRSLVLRRSEQCGRIEVNEKPYLLVTPVWNASRIARFHNGDVAENLSAVTSLAPVQAEKDSTGQLSAALAFDFRLGPLESFGVVGVFPLVGQPIELREFLAETGALVSPQDAFVEVVDRQTKKWRSLLESFVMSLPLPGLLDTVRAQGAYMLVNQDGPALQPGPRNYNRSWMRDGSLMAAALLRMGITNPVRSFIRWYTERVPPDGWVPPSLDTDGSINKGFGWDREYDSQGEYVFLVMEYYRFTGDRQTLETCYPAMRRAMKYLEKLLSRTRPPDYMRGSRFPERFRGILPPSISHEGYSSPVHSYWDDFWALRGLKDFRAAAIMMENQDDAAWAGRQYELLRSALSNSIRATVETAGIDYIPASADNADFDPSSVSIAFFPCEEQDLLPTAAVARLYRRYCAESEKRTHPGWKGAYTPYEARNINALCLLGMRSEALALLRFLLAGRHPFEWNAFAEVVHGDKRRGAYIGDLPHTWVGAALVTAVRNMVAMEQGKRLILLAGIPEEWLRSRDGVAVSNLPTRFGHLTMDAHLKGYTLKVTISGDVHPPAGVMIRWPIEKPSQVIVDGENWSNFDASGCYLSQVPKEVTAYW